MTWQEWADATAAEIRATGRWRTPHDFDAHGPEGKLAPDGAAVVSFASNDYLGLTQHPGVVDAAHRALDRSGAGSGSARLIVGSRPVHHELERALAAWKQEEAAALFPTGFAANLGVLGALAGPEVIVCSDELNHASIIDGCRLSRADVRIYPHRDLDGLHALLRDARDTQRRAIVVSDTVFSMDGDIVDVDGLTSVCRATNALLVVDEAHAVLGPQLTTQLLEGVEHLRVGTASKTLGALGGFVTGPHRYVDLIVNRARSYIFTTAPTPADTAAALAAVGVLQSPEGAALVDRLRAHVERVRPGHPSPIIPILLGDEDRTVATAAALVEKRVLVPAIRPPTVAPGTCRLRVALSAAHTDDHITLLLDALDAVVPGWR
jgi:8-amino-7-oxononanoate synthase